MTAAATEPPASSRAVTRGHGAVAGLLAAGVALSATVLADGLSRSVPSLVATVGQAVVNLTPGDAARAGVDAVGSANKPLILAGTVILSLVLGAVLGRFAVARRWVGFAGLVAFGLVGVAAAWHVDGVSVAGGLVAAIVGVVAGAAVLHILLRAATTDAAHPAERAADDAGGSPVAHAMLSARRSASQAVLTRRRFVTASSGAAAVAAFLAAGARRLPGVADSGTARASAQRAELSLPRPADPATPAASELDVAGADPWATPSDDFYRIDTALRVPDVDVESWVLRIDGMVERPLELTMDDLLSRPQVERWVTLACVSNEVGGDLVGNARWLGVPLLSLLEEAGVDPAADQVVGRSVDGFTAGFPVAAVVDGRDTLVVVGMNGEPLPPRHGFPARLVVPGLYGYVSATKWLSEIELTRFDSFNAFWIQRGWARLGPIKTQSRIDVPRRRDTLQAGVQPVAGVAWAPGTGIDRVEVRVDDGPWQEADIGERPTTDSWVQWVYRWDATPGEHVVSVRATDGTGETQTGEESDVFPDGATGWHTVAVRVS